MWKICSKFPSRKNVRSKKHPNTIDSSADFQLFERFRSLHNWSFSFVKPSKTSAEWKFHWRSKQNEKLFWKVHKLLTNPFLLLTKSETRESRERHTNEICFYTYDHLLDIFLNIRVSRYMNKWAASSSQLIVRESLWHNERCHFTLTLFLSLESFNGCRPEHPSRSLNRSWNSSRIPATNPSQTPNAQHPERHLIWSSKKSA